MSTAYVYVFDCVGCSDFYGEQKLNAKGELLCPNCDNPQRIDSPYVEKVRINK